MYVARSKKNVDDSDGSLFIRFKSSVGTDKTIGYCSTGKWQHPKPEVWGNTRNVSKYKPFCILSDISEEKKSENFKMVENFLRKYDIKVLNVSGHRYNRTSDLKDNQVQIQRFLTDCFKYIYKL